MGLRGNRVLRAVARRLPLISAYERRIADLTRQVAAQSTGEIGLWVPPDHFYSPVVDVAEIRRRPHLFADMTRALPGVDLGVDRQWALYDQLRPLLRTIEFVGDRAAAESAGRRYFSDNPAFGDGDGSTLEAMLRHTRPRRVVELGCGYSSACLLDTRERHLGLDVRVTFVDPFPQLLESLIRDADRATVDIMAVGTQDVPLDLIATLESGDVLFIDSTHVAKTGSDVVRIFHEILPAVRPGVWIHLHDHFAGFEYPVSWIEEGRSWNEQYLTRSFLQYNREFEIALWPTFLASLDVERFRCDVPIRVNGGGSLWLRRVA
ncbi:MAG: hypothetical protein B7C54_02365 [Acidimicrobiales bacterium mtb01]|nr:class I SAM-dependent methyltransferase [Actinomycetota bacterium]TEX47926.1 MAG: hypothetical protein B7C54_02365 [Acidimicrobiales bacterium mtb01]